MVVSAYSDTNIGAITNQFGGITATICIVCRCKIQFQRFHLSQKLFVCYIYIYIRISRTSVGGHFLIHNKLRWSSGSKLCTSSTNAARPNSSYVSFENRNYVFKVKFYQVIDRERMKQMANRLKSVRKSLCQAMLQETQTIVHATISW